VRHHSEFLIYRLVGNEAALFEPARTFGFLIRQIGLHTCLPGLGLRRAELRLRQALLCLQIVVPQFQQDLIGFDALTFFHQQVRDLPARRRRELGAAARLHRTGASIADRGFDQTALDLEQRHLRRLRTGEMPDCVG
jgi:hypothetical protein